MGTNTTSPKNKWSRGENVRTIEYTDEPKGQSFDHLEADEMEDHKEYKIMKRSESLTENRMHIIKMYV